MKMSEPIKGYRELSASEIDAINSVKTWEDRIGDLIQALREDQTAVPLDPKFTAVAVTHFQQGFMALTRAIAKPESNLK